MNKVVFAFFFSMLSGGYLFAMKTTWGESVTEANAWRDYPRPQLKRANWTNLNGMWNYSISSNAGWKAVSVASGKILVPFCFESRLSGVARTVQPGEKMTYSRKFDARRKKGMRTILNFEAVDWRAQVFVNGFEAMDVPHEGGNLPFSVDVTDFIRDGENDLKVVAWDPTHTFINAGGKQNDKTQGCFYTRVSGIWQTVWMEEVPENHVVSYRVVTDIDRARVSFEFVTSGGDAGEDVEIAVYDAEGAKVAVNEAPAGETLVIDMPRGFRLWSPDSPYLYSFKARFGDDVFSGYFGMRKIDKAQDPNGVWRFRLNNEFVFPIGTLDQGWWPDGLLTPPSADACAFDIMTLKKCGFNMMRKHIKVEPRVYYYLCDKLGIMVFQDAPSPAGYANIFNETKSLQRYGMFRREWKEEIDTLRNHPSIVMWIPYNEAWGQPDEEYTADTLRWTKRYDPTRLVGGPSGWNDYEGGDMLSSPDRRLVRDPWKEECSNPSSDVVDQHNYPGPGQCRHRKHRISLLGEFGGLGLRVDGHMWNPKKSWGYGGTGMISSKEKSQKSYLELMKRLLPLVDDGLGGTVYTQTTDVELEINGLMTYDRKVLKFDVDALREAHREIIERAASAAAAAPSVSDSLSWPEPTAEMKPWVYNWWMGCAVDEKGIEYQCSELSSNGFGGFHVIPIYGANGYEKKYRKLLSPEWVEAWNMAARTARRHSLGIDLTMGAGWCFGGPWVTKDFAASSGIKVKRAGPGGEGFMIDPFSPAAMSNHVSRFAALFGPGGKIERPRAFYHDSYEYYNSRPKNGGNIDELQVKTFKVWTDWCRENGYLTRNQAHGAPSNWLDFYAIADIPETEMFGKKSRDILLSKFASSTAHAKGTKLVAAESCTWIDEHFCERPAEIKIFLDKLFLSGVNHVFYHGLCYSPTDAAWPGWCFYASLEMNPRNPIWREIRSLNDYVTRCQSIFQTWEPDNDLALIWDAEVFRRKPGNEFKQMTIHDGSWFYSSPLGQLAKELFAAGYSFDYVSPRMIAAGLAKKYAEVIDPASGERPKKARRMPFGGKNSLEATRWKKNGRTLYFVVNQGKNPVMVRSDRAFQVMNPLDGGISRVSEAVIAPSHSLFVEETKSLRAEPVNAGQEETKPFVCGPWNVEAVCGGPVPPAKKTLRSPASWHTWDENFSGTMRYTASFGSPGIKDVYLDLGEVREIARVKVNGVDLGVRFMPPYSYKCPDGLLKPSGNVLEVEVTGLGANRLRWNDKTGVNWKYFRDINMVGMNYLPLDAAKWPVRPSGLIGPVKWIGGANKGK